MKTYEFDGEKYKAASLPQKEWGTSLISQLSLHGDESILDLGCGDGALTEQLALLVPNGKVLGIDASAGMIKTAKKICKDNLTFIQMDINHLHFPDEFHIIYSNAALHWVKDHRRLLRNSYTTLKAGGILLWSFGGEGNCSHFLETMHEITAEDKYKKYFSDYESPWFMPSQSQYHDLLSNAGFSEYTVTLINRDRYFPTSDDMIKWIDQPCIVPYMEHIPATDQSAFRKEVIEKMLEKTQQKNGTCFETFRRIQIYAKK